MYPVMQWLTCDSPRVADVISEYQIVFSLESEKKNPVLSCSGPILGSGQLVHHIFYFVCIVEFVAVGWWIWEGAETSFSFDQKLHSVGKWTRAQSQD